MSGEDLAVIIVDRGMMDDHLPNNVLAALKRCQSEVRRRAAASRPKETVRLEEETPVDGAHSAIPMEVMGQSAESNGEGGQRRERTSVNKGQMSPTIRVDDSEATYI